jgi:EutQ-like cupin domain
MVYGRSAFKMTLAISAIALIEICYSFTFNNPLRNSVGLFEGPLGTSKTTLLKTSTTTTSQSKTKLYAGTSVGPRPLHTEFTVEKATPEKLKQLDVMKWPTWSTSTSPKYKVGIKSPLKVYDCNELSYITKGEVEIIDAKTGIASTVTVGDFVTFPNGYECYWFVKETITKHWYIY